MLWGVIAERSRNMFIMLIMPLVILISITLYVGIIILLPFNQTASIILLFALVSFWSRLPGVGINDPTWIIYCFDLIDMFSMIIAINVGGIYGGVFAALTNIVPRFCGFYPVWISVLYDALAQCIVCLAMPFIYHISGGDLINSMIIYTVLRIIIIMPISFFLNPRPVGQWILEWITSIFGLFIANLFWTRIFGSHMNKLLEQGARFDWLLFLVVSLIIAIFYLIYAAKTGIKIKLNLDGILRNVSKSIVHDSNDKTIKMEESSKEEIDDLKKIKNMMRMP
jgi:hypothetical protein